MCGLVAVITKHKNGFSQQQKDVFTTLLYLDNLRGKDSAGAFVVSNLGNVKMAKQASSADGFITSKEYKELEQAAYTNGWAMVGHNRAATRGEVNDANAHPFIVDDKIVLVHNGTFFGDHKKIKDTAVDSEVIAHLLAEEDDVEAALRKVNAAFALIWYNVHTKTLNFIRNKERPLCILETDNEIVFASQTSFLNFVIEHFGLKPKKREEKDVAYPFGLVEFCHGSFTLQENRDMEVDWKMLENAKFTYQAAPSNGGTANDAAPFREAIDRVDVSRRGRVRRVATEVRLLEDQRPLKEVYGTKSQYQQERVAGQVDEPKPVHLDDMPKFAREYPIGKPIKILISDYIDEDPYDKNSTNVIMIGKTLDEHELDAVFTIRVSNGYQLASYINGEVFEAVCTGLTWWRHPKLDTGPITNPRGMLLCHFDHPQQVFQNETSYC